MLPTNDSPQTIKSLALIDTSMCNLLHKNYRSCKQRSPQPSRKRAARDAAQSRKRATNDAVDPVFQQGLQDCAGVEELVLDLKTSLDMDVDREEEAAELAPTTWKIISPAAEWTASLVENFIIDHPTNAPVLAEIQADLENPQKYATVQLQHPISLEQVKMRIDLVPLYCVPQYAALLGVVLGV
tara:strand:- start:73 stop:624 length:552 start_codon:yes stop_codon:yes gene_type:complete